MRLPSTILHYVVTKVAALTVKQFRGPDGWTVETKESVGYVGVVDQQAEILQQAEIRAGDYGQRRFRPPCSWQGGSATVI